MIKKRFISMLVLLITAVSGAWAQEETLLTTIESTGDNASFKSGSKTFDNIATVTFSGNVLNDDDEWGWYSNPELTLTVTAAEGYTITRVKFYTDEGSAFDEQAPFEAILVGYIAKVNGNSIGECGVTKIEVYGYAGAPAPATYTVSMKESTEDATSWQGKAGEGTYQQLPLEGVAQGTQVSLKYGGALKVKSVKAKKKAAPAPATAEGHALSASVVGELVGSDGKAYAVADKDKLPQGVTAVAMVAYVGSGTDHATYTHGLAIALADESDSYWSTAKSTCEGKAAVSDAAWLLPSQNQWKAMFKAFGDNDASYIGLNTAITSAGGTPLQGYEDYWTSSEYDSDNAYFVILYDVNVDWYYEVKDDEDYKVRACLAF